MNPDEDKTVIGAPADGGAALPAGHALQEYVIEGVVGEGGFGIVYLARDTRLGRNVALKEYMPASLAARSSNHVVSVRSERHRETFEMGLRSFVNEAQLLASFDHPSLVKVYRFWEANGTAYMVMPFYQGPTLKKWLKELGTAPDERWLLALLQPMIDALEQLHHDHCYHRDIAPDNILLLPLQGTQAGGAAIAVRPLLLDFGAARRVIGDMTHALTVILKPGYAPIEQYADSAVMKQGPWTDVYALSAVLYACVTGRAPVPSVSRIITDDMLPAAQAGAGRYSPMFLEAIDAGLAVRPEQRPQSMVALRELFAATSHDALGFTPLPPAREPTARPPVSRPAPPAPVRDTHPGRLEPVMSTPADDEKTVLAPPGARRPPGPSPGARTTIGQTATGGGTRAGIWAAAAGGAMVLGLAAWWWIQSGNNIPAAPGKPAVALPGGPSTAPAPPPGLAPTPTPAPATVAEAATGSAATRPAAAPSTSAPAPTGGPTGAPPATRPAAADAANPGAAAAGLAQAPFSVLNALQDIVARGDARITVTATPDKSSVTIGRDALRFRVRSSEPGYLYLFTGGTEKSHFWVLFPNQLDAHNRIEGGRDVMLPRKTWEIVAEGPPGTNHIVALVSRYERNLADGALLRTADAIPEFDMAVAEQRWTQRLTSPGELSPFIGKARCAAPPCDEAYGARMFEINEVTAGKR